MIGRIISIGVAVAGSVGFAWAAWERWWRPLDRSDLGLLLGVGVLGLAWLFSLAGWAWREDAEKASPWRILALLAALACFAVGAEASATRAFTFMAMPWYCAGTLAFAWGALQPAAAPRARGVRPPWPSLAAMGVLALGSAWAIPAARRAFRAFFETPDDRYSVHLLFMTRGSGGAMDIPGGPFEPVTLLWLLPALLGLLGLLLAWRAWPAFRPWAPYAAAAWGLLAKVCLAGLSSKGLGIIGIKIASINTAYYTLTERADAMGWGAFIRGFSALQGSLGPHGETHSFLPILVYKALRVVSFDSPGAVGVMVGAINALIAIPVWRLAERHFKHPAAGLAAALLLLSSPLGSILSAAGIDAMVALCVAVALERLDQAARSGSWKASLQAGLAAFVGSLLSYGFPLVNLFFFPWVWAVLARMRGGWLPGALPAALWLGAYSAAFLGLHGLLYAATGGGFNALQGLATAGNTHHSINLFRLYEVWSWGNVILYAGYMGVGLLAAWLWRSALVLWQGEPDDDWALLALPLVATLVLSAMGRGEVQRMFLYAIVFLAPAATGALIFQRADGRRLHLPGLWALTCLNLATAAVLQAHVLDYW